MRIKRLFKNEYLVSILTMVVNLAISMVYSMLIARYLGAEIKGMTAYIASVAAIGSKFLMFGLHQSYAFYRNQNDKIKDKYINHIYVIFLFYAVIALTLCLIWRGNVIIMASIIMAVLGAYSGIIAYIYLIENSVKRNISMVFIHLLQVTFVVILFLVAKPNIFWGITNLIFVDVVIAIMYTIKLKVKFSFRSIDLRFLFEIFRMGFIPMITILVSGFNYKIDVLMLETFPNVTFAGIGVYSIGLMLADKVLLIPETLKGILLSRLARGKEADEVAKVMRMCLPVCFVMFGGIFLLGEKVIGWMYGPQYDGAYMITMITMFGVGAHMFYNMIEVYNIVHKKQKVTLIVASCSVVANIVINGILIPRYGITGAAVATLISYTGCAVALLSYFSWQTKIKFKNLVIINKKDINEVLNMIGKKKDK